MMVDYTMAENLQDIAYAIIIVFPVLSTIVVGLRCWARFLSRQFGWDDGLIVFAWLLAIGQTYTVWMYTKLTYQGYHASDIPPLSIEQKVTGGKYNLANQLLYNPILAIVKASVIVFLFRLQDRRRVVQWNLHALSAVNICLLVSIFLADLFQCTPLRYMYAAVPMDLAAQRAAGADEDGMKDGELVKGGQCIDQIGFFLGSAAFTIVTDVWLLCIPAIIVWQLHMGKKKKLAILGVLSMGIIVTALGIARLAVYARRFSPSNKDFTYNIGHTISGAEANMAIITASATALNSLISKYAPRFWTSTADYSTSMPGGGRSAGVSRARTDTFAMKEGFRRNKEPSDSQEEIMTFDGRLSISHASGGSSSGVRGEGSRKL